MNKDRNITSNRKKEKIILGIIKKMENDVKFKKYELEELASSIFFITTKWKDAKYLAKIMSNNNQFSPEFKNYMEFWNKRTEEINKKGRY